MINKEILFDHKLFFRIQDILRIYIKYVLTKLHLRNKQSCKYCGRDQYIVWKCKNKDWNKLPKKWYYNSLCLECFVYLHPKKFNLNDIEIIGYE